MFAESRASATVPVERFVAFSAVSAAPLPLKVPLVVPPSVIPLASWMVPMEAAVMFTPLRLVSALPSPWIHAIARIAVAADVGIEGKESRAGIEAAGGVEPEADVADDGIRFASAV